MLAESMVILLHISQLGCFNESSNRILLKSSIGFCLKGPPEPVNIILLICSFFSPIKKRPKTGAALTSLGFARAPGRALADITVQPNVDVDVDIDVDAYNTLT